MSTRIKAFTMALLAPIAASAQEATTYQLDPAGSDLYVVIRYDRESLASGMGHDHVIAARTFDGTVTWPAEGASGCEVDISFPVSELVVDPGRSRSQMGLDDNTISDKDKDKLKKNMWGKSQLYASNFPRISFRATSCSGSGSSVTVKGEISVRGVGKAISVPMTVSADGSSFSARGSFKLTHADFGFSPYVAPLGVLRNQESLEFLIDVKGRAR